MKYCYILMTFLMILMLSSGMAAHAVPAGSMGFCAGHAPMEGASSLAGDCVGMQGEDTLSWTQARDTASLEDILPKREIRRLRRDSRNMRFSILGGPGYSPDFGLTIGGSALFTFRMDKSDLELKRSVVPIAIAAMTKGGVKVVSKPQLFFAGDRFRIFGQFQYEYFPDNFYGVGYTTNRDYVRSASTSLFRESELQLNPLFLFRIRQTDWFAGPYLDFTWETMSDVGAEMVRQKDYAAAGGDESGYETLSTGLGFLVTLDSRDVPANAYKGVYFDFRAAAYNDFMGMNGLFNDFYRVDLDYRQYLSVGERKTFAWTVQSKNVFGDVPLNKYSLIGTPFDLRGYYWGQYRDKSAHMVIAEYRQMINTDRTTWVKKALSRLGFVAWGGCGFLGPDPFRIEGVLPNAGLGIRIEVQPRMNVRLDFGRNFINGQNLFYFNMTEAF